MNIRRFVVVEGIMSTYIHGQGSTGVIVKFDADDAAINNAGFAELAKNVALQVAAMAPVYLDKASVPESALNEEKEILSAQIKNDPATANKPQAIIDKMVIGRLNKFYEKNCLAEQAYVKDDSLTVGKYVAEGAKSFGGKIALAGFWCFEKGEGLEKKEENFAEEIAKMVNN